MATEEKVEAAARVLYEFEPIMWGPWREKAGMFKTWEDLSEATRDTYRHKARKVVAAIGLTQV